jgi:bifunctional DNA-binding transcriptional regulator/antitoxin component of YhaV-PrlF toxin-antitoxin module
VIPPPTREDLGTDVEAVYAAVSKNVVLHPLQAAALCRLLADARKERKEIADAFVRMEKVANSAVAELKALREKAA